MKLQKFFSEEYILFEITIMQFECMQLSKVLCYYVFPKILVIILSRILLDGIVHNFARNMRNLIYDIGIIFAGITC